jgi:pectate lyase
MGLAGAPQAAIPCAHGLHAEAKVLVTALAVGVALVAAPALGASRTPDRARTATVAATVTVPPSTGAGPPLAFPGAQGGGARSVGGRGGAVYAVTSLADTSAPGTLRHCVTRSGPRTCVFRVAGTITLTSTLTITNPYLTVAGQTAPGGIQLSGKNLLADMIRISTHDVIWRYTHVNKGYTAGAKEGPGSNIQLLGGAYNVVIDHNSLLWTQDGNLDGSSGFRDTTLSYNLIAEPLAAHPFMMLLSGPDAASSARSNVDMHHNYLANFGARGPYMRLGKARLYNNLVYNWDSSATRTTGGGDYDFVGNWWKRGPLSPTAGSSPRGVREIDAYLSPGAYGPAGNPTFYVAGNEGPSCASPDGDEWAMLRSTDSEGGNRELEPVPTARRRTTPLPSWGEPIIAEPVATLPDTLLPVVGASRRLDCSGAWVDARDAADARIVANWSNGGGSIPAKETDVGGFATQKAGAPCADTDGDGMPDAWELAHGLDPHDPADANAVAAGQPYTNLELYLAGR